VVEVEKKLTGKQQRFVDAYLSNGFNATKAALAAGYSERSAQQIGSENLLKPVIAEFLQQRMAELAMPANEVLARLAEHARGDLGDFIAVAYEDLATHEQSRLLKKVKRTVTVRRSRKGDDETETTKEELELYSAQAALETLARIHGLLKTDININVSIELVTKTVQALEAAGIDATEFFEKARARAEQRRGARDGSG
jgi:phage terminase small subunit